MRIAIAGAHATGKSTLVAELAWALPGHPVVEEPYYQFEAEGHAFAERPALEDVEAQLARSLRDVSAPRAAVIFDRSPADFLAYLLAHRDGGRADVARWFPDIGDAVRTLDLVVFVPIERPDRVVAPEAPRLRRQVDAALRARGCSGFGPGRRGVGMTVGDQSVCVPQ